MRLLLMALLIWASGGYATEEITVDLSSGITIEFVWIEPGVFLMGSPSLEVGRDSDEVPEHEVEISRGFWLGKYEITQAQWEQVIRSNPSRYRGPARPVENVSWQDVQGFIHRLNEAVGDSVYRLPTEGEWEYAARAGMTRQRSLGGDGSQLGDYAWYNGNNSPIGTKEVGTKLPNPWGLYDMYGNVWEWCQDWYGSYNISPRIDPTGPPSGSHRVLRGGYFDLPAQLVRSAYRFGFVPTGRLPNMGMRLLKIGSPPTAVYPVSWGQIKSD